MELRKLALAAALVALPFTANAVSVTTKVDGALAGPGPIILAPFMTATIEMDGNDADGADQIITNFVANPGLKDLTVTASLNENPLVSGNGFLGAEFEIRTGLDGDLDGLLDTLTGPAVQPNVSGGEELTFASVIAAGSPFQIIARFTDVVGNGQNFDLRVQAVPLPAPLVLLLAGIGGLGLVSRSRKAA